MSRDDQFAGFAKKLSQEILVEIDWIMQSEGDIERIIARRAYDLACHVASNIPSHEIRRMDAGLISDRQIVNNIHDMRQWPEETNR